MGSTVPAPSEMLELAINDDRGVNVLESVRELPRIDPINVTENRVSENSMPVTSLRILSDPVWSSTSIENENVSPGSKSVKFSVNRLEPSKVEELTVPPLIEVKAVKSLLKTLLKSPRSLVAVSKSNPGESKKETLEICTQTSDV